MRNPELERGRVILLIVHKTGGTRSKDAVTANSREKIDLLNMFPNFFLNEWEASN